MGFWHGFADSSWKWKCRLRFLFSFGLRLLFCVSFLGFGTSFFEILTSFRPLNTWDSTIGLWTHNNSYDLGYGWTLDAWDIDSFSSDFFRHGRIGSSQLFGSLCLDFEWWRNEHLWECKVTAQRN
ncbi:hypothetical protein RhiirA1_478406 [Rhizophagus irregularis]|uniref:Uncharacterized protein n=1 Tax=Rhizophagus irregularis TaxID=588596 RepID=A0A2N0QS50_9GLOM|nr:hypothetical protein RhiirA1_478406 [Rhizophagus irregularis]